MEKSFLNEFRELRKSYRVCRFPIVLCQGLLGFDTLKTPRASISYWHGIKEVLESYGARVHSNPVEPLATVEIRASLILSETAKHCRNQKVNLIAHSMGGLDARFVASMLAEMRNPPFEVASLTTISTPHWGSSVADLFLPLTRRLYGSLGAFAQLSTVYAAEQFNTRIKNDERVYYASYGASASPKWPSLLKPTHDYLMKREGPNDGLVSVKSAVWGDYKGTLQNCDHWDVVNLSTLKLPKQRNLNYSATAMYLHIMDELAGSGF